MFELTTGEKKRLFQELDALISDDADSDHLDDEYEESRKQLKYSQPSNESSNAPTNSMLKVTQVASARRNPSFNGPSSFEKRLSRTISTSRVQIAHLRHSIQQLKTPLLARSTSAPSVTSQLAGGFHMEGNRMKTAAPARLPKSSSTTNLLEGAKRAASGTSKTSGSKRKRDAVVDLVDENKQIFKDLVFYFCPNDDVNKRRKARIDKAIQHGASWSKNWSSDVTHVVADKDVDYKFLCKHLSIDLASLHVGIVNEDWIPNCVQWLHLLNPWEGKRFRVAGHQDAIDSKDNHSKVVQMQASQTSLQLKPARKGVLVQKPETPPAEALSQSTTLVEATPAKASPTSPNDVRIANAEPKLHAPEYHDELSDAIASTKAVSHLPLDVDDEDVRSVASSKDGSEFEEEQPTKSSKVQFTKKLQSTAWQESFHCMQRHDGTSKAENPNARTIELLQEMLEHYQRIKDDWRIVAYRKAIASLRKCTWKITTKQDAIKLPNIGESLAGKIEEVVWTDRLQKLENAKADSADSPLQLFLGVYGAGLKQASRWIAAGHTSLDDLRKADITTNQRVGIEHYADFNSRIPREEVAQHGAIVKKYVQRLDPAFEVIIMGSYRRGAQDSGDIDLIITKPQTAIETIQSVVFKTLIPQLFDKGFLVAALATSSRDAAGSKFMGASILPVSKSSPGLYQPWRRIDILTVPEEEMGAALIYFTGNDIFNRSIRLLASKKGMRLNQKGLFRDVLKDKGREKITDGTLVESRSEEKIFEILGVPWRPPHHRIC